MDTTPPSLPLRPATRTIRPIVQSVADICAFFRAGVCFRNEKISPACTLSAEVWHCLGIIPIASRAHMEHTGFILVDNTRHTSHSETPRTHVHVYYVSDHIGS